MAQWDFFISYKWNTYAQEASSLKTVATGRGFSVWLDVDHPYQRPQGSPDMGDTADAALVSHLKAAIASCRYVLFFETFAVAAMQIGGPTIRVKTWQERELDLASQDKMMTFYHGGTPRTLVFGRSNQMHPYGGLTDAFAMVERALTDSGKYFWAS